MRPITLTTEDGLRLKAELRSPDGPPKGAAVLCHPHPRHGGSKDHPLLWLVRNELAGTRGFAVLAFNFRGIMGSEGTYGGGVDELADVAAAVRAVREEAAAGPLLLVGWSFGASVALRYAVSNPGVAGLALIGAPVGETSVRLPDLPDKEALGALDARVLLVSGAFDQFSPAPELRSLGRRLAHAEVQLIPDTGHFFERREREVAERIGAFAEGLLGS